MKYNILVIPSDTSGCGKFRSLDPHKYLNDHYGDIFNVTVKFPNEVFEEKDRFPEFLKEFDLIHIHKQLDRLGIFIQICKYLGKKVIVDVDDHYDLGMYHPMSATAKQEKWADIVITHLKYADYVTTTTELYRKTLLKHNSNVVVLPNAVDPNESQFKPIDIPSKRLRVGIICGSSHLHDLKLLENMVGQFSKEELDKLQFVLCGFDTRGNSIILNADGTKTVKPINPIQTCWYEYEKILTNNYSTISSHYVEFLHLFAPDVEYPNVEKFPYRRCWTKPVESYATHYNNIDVLLVPLKDTEFNRSKSQLKVIEAGFFHKAIIASNVGPYTIDLKNAVTKGGEIDTSGNALLVDASKNSKNWSKYIKLLLKNENLLHQLQENLYETVKEKYSLKTISEKRKKFYLEILKK